MLCIPIIVFEKKLKSLEKQQISRSDRNKKAPTFITKIVYCKTTNQAKNSIFQVVLSLGSGLKIHDGAGCYSMVSAIPSYIVAFLRWQDSRCRYGRWMDKNNGIRHSGNC
jgi:hypothetical protein